MNADDLAAAATTHNVLTLQQLSFADSRKGFPVIFRGIGTRELVNKEFRLENVIGDSPQMQVVLNLVNRVSRSDAAVLISGESGTGK